jgi:hypothetical protein
LLRLFYQALQSGFVNITMVFRSLCYLVLSASVFASAWMIPPSNSRSTKCSSTHRFAEKIAFSKYEGLGNDFILIDNRDRTEPSLTPQESEKLCDRNFGIGGDGVIFALKPPSDDYDFTMRIYNSDGSEPVGNIMGKCIGYDLPKHIKILTVHQHPMNHSGNVRQWNSMFRPVSQGYWRRQGHL